LSKAVTIHKSGETLDTLEAMRFAKKRGSKTVAVVNQPESTMAREADAVLATLAGPEIGVASTKAFTTQLAVLAAFTVAMARARGTIDAAGEAALAGQLAAIPSRAKYTATENSSSDEPGAKSDANGAPARPSAFVVAGSSGCNHSLYWA